MFIVFLFSDNNQPSSAALIPTKQCNLPQLVNENSVSLNLCQNSASSQNTNSNNESNSSYSYILPALSYSLDVVRNEVINSFSKYQVMSSRTISATLAFDPAKALSNPTTIPPRILA